ncbi:MAG: VCBS repeat-containing protein [Gammaproteobacteria bacterium]|nr:VCBS repeat-containing protein [Gammaproteobacteria bacterium]
MRHRMLRVGAVACGAAAIGTLVLGVAALLHVEHMLPLPVESNRWMRVESLGTHYFLNDLVGFDTRSASLPEALIVSHSARAAALTAGAAGEARLVWADGIGLSQDPNLPGWGGAGSLPERRGTLQIDYLHTMIVGRVAAPGAPGAELHVGVPWPARVARRGGVELAAQDVDGRGTRLRFALNGPGAFHIEPWPPPSDGFRIDFDATGLPASAIVIGGRHRSPARTAFSLETRDFHSVALGELDGDGGAEFSVVRGGARGRIGAIQPASRDLLYDVDTGREVGESYTGLQKEGCPGRQSAWVDVEGDNRLELYIVCGRSAEGFPNRLLRRNGRGFADVAREAGLDLQGVGSFRFVDWTLDLQPDLLWVDGSGDVVLYRNREGRFAEAQRIASERPSAGRVTQLLLEDIDRDGAPDLLIVHPSGNRLIMNRSARLVEAAPSEHGLPVAALAGAFVDVDLDGHTDLLTERGLFRGIEAGRFARDSAASERLGGWVRQARLVSFASGDERRLLLALNRCLPGRFCGWRRSLLQRMRRWALAGFALQRLGLLEREQWVLLEIGRSPSASGRREIALTLTGEAGNPYGVGARIDIEGPDGPRRHWVGQAESSHYSQGNFAVYVTAPVADEVRGEAVWQDGCRAQFSVPAAVRRMTVVRPVACGSQAVEN